MSGIIIDGVEEVWLFGNSGGKVGGGSGISKYIKRRKTYCINVFRQVFC